MIGLVFIQFVHCENHVNIDRSISDGDLTFAHIVSILHFYCYYLNQKCRASLLICIFHSSILAMSSRCSQLTFRIIPNWPMAIRTVLARRLRWIDECKTHLNFNVKWISIWCGSKFKILVRKATTICIGSIFTWAICHSLWRWPIFSEQDLRQVFEMAFILKLMLNLTNKAFTSIFGIIRILSDC